MLVHMVMWKYKEDTPQVKKFEHLALLKALPDAIPDIMNFEVGNDILKLDRSYDIGLVAVFENQETLDAYTNHDKHQEVAELGKEIAKNIGSVDFVVD